MIAPVIALASVLAIGIGFAVGLLGSGGSILTTPLLVYVVGFDAKSAITASLLVVAVTSAFGLISHARAGRVIWRTGLIFGGAGMVGAFAGGQIGQHLPGSLLLAAFSVMMALTAVAMIRGRRRIAVHGTHTGLPIARILLDGLVVGFVTGLVGAGGGFLVVPALALLGGLAMPNAVATSLLVVSMKSVAGFLGYVLEFGDGSLVRISPMSDIDWLATFAITGGAACGAVLGSRLVGRVHPNRLRVLFGWFVLAMAVFILSQQVGSTVIEFASGGLLNLLEVLAGAIAIIVGFVWIIRRPVQEQIADYDEPEIALEPPTSGEGPSRG